MLADKCTGAQGRLTTEEEHKKLSSALRLGVDRMETSTMELGNTTGGYTKIAAIWIKML